VLQHHTNVTRDGVYTDPLMTKALAATLKLTASFNPTITGNVYAQPLYVTNGPGGKEAFIVVTEQNHVLAIDASATSTGAILWEHPSSASDATNYGTPVTGVGTALGCGNIDPLGITGTPVIDPSAGARAIYFDAMTSVGGKPTHKIYAVSLDDGTIKSGWPVVVDTAITGFTSKTQNERGALALVNGVVYVPYGGHNGDCDNPPYHGWVVGVPVGAPGTAKGFSTGSIGTPGTSEAGIWAVGGVASDGTSLFVATGNHNNPSPAQWSGGEAILRLAAGPAYTDNTATDTTHEFHVTDWPTADSTDADLGGANPVLFDLPDGNGGVLHLVGAFSKDGFLYILNRDNLGGEGGQLTKTSLADQNTTFTGSLKAAPAAYTTSQGTYVAYRINIGVGMACPGGARGDLGVAKITLVNGKPTPTVAWCSAETGLGSPMVTTTGTDVIVWDASNRLYGYDGDTGTKVFAGGGTADAMASAMQYFNTPIGANGRMVVATSGPGRLYVFKP
jgi:hypothetical protein